MVSAGVRGGKGAKRASSDGACGSQHHCAPRGIWGCHSTAAPGELFTTCWTAGSWKEGSSAFRGTLYLMYPDTTVTTGAPRGHSDAVPTLSGDPVSISYVCFAVHYVTSSHWSSIWSLRRLFPPFLGHDSGCFRCPWPGCCIPWPHRPQQPSPSLPPQGDLERITGEGMNRWSKREMTSPGPTMSRGSRTPTQDPDSHPGCLLLLPCVLQAAEQRGDSQHGWGGRMEGGVGGKAKSERG